MLTIQIDKDENSNDDIVIYLEYIKSEIEKGFTCGEGWDIIETKEDN